MSGGENESRERREDRRRVVLASRSRCSRRRSRTRRRPPTSASRASAAARRSRARSRATRPRTRRSSRTTPTSDLVVGPFRPKRVGPGRQAGPNRLRLGVERRRAEGRRSRCRSTSSRRRTSTRTARSGPTSATSAATARGRSSRSAAPTAASHRSASDPPRTAAWGYCDRDYPRAAIVSPYTFKTAQEHYEALLAETKTRGGPTQHTYATVPGDWSGRYVWPRGQNWYAELLLQPDADDPVAADARVSDADGAVRVSRLGHRTRRSGRRSTAGPRASCGAGTTTPSRISRTRSS